MTRDDEDPSTAGTQGDQNATPPPPRLASGAPPPPGEANVSSHDGGGANGKATPEAAETGENDPTSGTGSSDSDDPQRSPAAPVVPNASSSTVVENGASRARDGSAKKKVSGRSASWIGVGRRASGASGETSAPPKQAKGRRSMLSSLPARRTGGDKPANDGNGGARPSLPSEASGGTLQGGTATSHATAMTTAVSLPGAVRVRGIHSQEGDESSSKSDDDPTALVQAGRGDQGSRTGAPSREPLDDIESGAFTASTLHTTVGGGGGGDDTQTVRGLLTTVTATAVSQDDLEQEVRDRLRREAVVAQATDDAPESARDEQIKTKKPRRSYLFVLLIILVASAIVGVTLIVLLTGSSGGSSSEASNTTESPPRVWTPEELKDFIIAELGTSRGFELNGFTPAKASYELILAGGTFNNVTLGTQLMDAFVLLALWAGTGGERGWTRSDGWNRNPHPCTWYGIGCNEKGRVAKISVPGNNLKGPLNPDLRYLAGQLTHLDVSDNKVGLFKFNLTSLPNLQYFNFSKNANSNLTIESVMHYNLTRLEVLDLSSCVLGGPISAEIARLSKLRKLHLQGNSLTGSIPDEIASLSSLISLRVEDNQLSGSIPVDVCSRVAASGENASLSVDCAEVACSCCSCETS